MFGNSQKEQNDLRATAVSRRNLETIREIPGCSVFTGATGGRLIVNVMTPTGSSVAGLGDHILHRRGERPGIIPAGGLGPIEELLK